MFLPRVFRLIRDTRLSVPILSHVRSFHHEFSNPEPNKQDDKNQLTAAVQAKYKIFRDEESPEIFDVEEEKQRYQLEDEPEEPDVNGYLGLNLKRGLHGVFDIDDLVEVLKKENAKDIFVCAVPKDLKYVDYLVVVTGRSFRHMSATAGFVRRIYKMKRTKGDILPKIEGENSREWMAMDLGNIALHIFSSEARRTYDLESLWGIGAEFDKECNKPEDPLVELFEKHSIFLHDLKPKQSGQ